MRKRKLAMQPSAPTASDATVREGEAGAAQPVMAGAQRTKYYHSIEFEALLTLGWAAPMTTRQLWRMIAPWMHVDAFRTKLRKLQQEDLLHAEMFSREQPNRPPQRVGYVWTLTSLGYEHLGEHSQEPRRLVPLVRALLDHDLVLSELITCIVERSRHVLSGIYVERETRIDGVQKRPRCDAILILRRSPPFVPGTIPWLSRPPTPEESVRAYAVEIDRDTEPIGVIRDKAVSYETVWKDAQFYQRYHRFPCPLWIVPDDRRLRVVWNAWKAVWPDGRWLMTTDAGLQTDTWQEYVQQTQVEHRLLSGWDLQHEEAMRLLQ